MKSRLLTIACLLLIMIDAGTAFSISTDDGWSSTGNGIQSRLTLVQEQEHNGTRWLVPYLELRNVREAINQMEINCDRNHLKIELVNAKGEPIRSGWIMPRSGPPPELNTVILPWHSSITLSLENKNWGIPRNAAAMVSTDSGAWVLEDAEKGKVFLRARLTNEPIKPSFNNWKRWYGTIQTPLIKVDWK
jgi:hypothetical protein